MTELPFPAHTWGAITGLGSNKSAIERIRIAPSPAGGFIIVTKEARGTFDTWVETANDVREFLKALDVDWESGS